MAVYGYARVSSGSQSLAIQQDALLNAGCEIVRSEKVSGTRIAGRDELRTLIDFTRENDVLVVTRIDRLARSIADLSALVNELEAKGVKLKAIEQPIDTTTAAGRAFLQMLGVFAEFETSIRRERQMEGIAKAKMEGRYKGRPAKIDADEVRSLQAGGMGAQAIATKMGISRASVYRALA